MLGGEEREITDVDTHYILHPTALWFSPTYMCYNHWTELACHLNYAII